MFRKDLIAMLEVQNAGKCVLAKGSGNYLVIYGSVNKSTVISVSDYHRRID